MPFGLLKQWKFVKYPKHKKLTRQNMFFNNITLSNKISFQIHKYCGFQILDINVYEGEKKICLNSAVVVYYCIKRIFIFSFYTFTENEMAPLLRGQHSNWDYKRLRGFQTKNWCLKMHNKIRLCSHPWQISSSQKWLV